MPEVTSLIAYKQIIEEGTARTQKHKIFWVVEEHFNIHNEGLSLREIASFTNYDINAVSGRVNDLKKEGVLETDKKRYCTITKRLISPVVPALTVKKVKQEDIEIEANQLILEGV